MMCPVTIPGSEQDWQSKNAIKKSIQIHFVYLKSGAMSFFFFLLVLLFLYVSMTLNIYMKH